MPTCRPAMLLLSLLLALSFEAYAQPAASKSLPPREMVRQARQHLKVFRAAFERNRDSLNEADARQIQTRLDETEKAVEDYSRLLERGADHTNETPLFAMGGVIVADDATGIGVADDLLLPAIGVALAVLYVKAEITASMELTESRNRLHQSSQALVVAVEMALATKKNDGKCHCKCARRGEMGESKGRRTPQECEQICRQEGFTVPICK